MTSQRSIRLNELRAEANPLNVQFTEMTPRDYDEVFALWESTENLGMSGADSRDSIHAYLARNPGLSLVARRERRIVGAVLCGHDARRGYLHHLAVTRTDRGNGIGAQLVELCLARLAELGIQKCHIFLHAENELGEQFWKRNGWVERTELKMLSKHTSARAT